MLLIGFHSEAGDRIGYEQFKIYADTADLSFEQLYDLEAKGQVQFQDFDGLSSKVYTYWIKIDSSLLEGVEYLFFSNFFDLIEAYYPGKLKPYAITGRFVNFEERGYKKGFYRHVLLLKENDQTLYVKLSSLSGNSLFNRSLSHIEISTAADLEEQSTLILTSFALLTGMELIILLINLFLVYLKPSKTGYSYAIFILTGILLANFNTQIFVDLSGVPAVVIHYGELIVGVLIVYAFNLFSAYFLQAIKYSKRIHYALVFPVFPIIIGFAFVSNGIYFPTVSSAYFIVSVVIVFYLTFTSRKENAHISKIFLIANGLSVIAALAMLLALKGYFDHHFMTTNVVFLGFILRDVIFTFDLMKNYFKMETNSILRKTTIEKLTEEKEQLKSIEQLKTRFFNNVSHELRTPLTLILSPLESSLKNDKIPDEIKRELNLSLKNGKYLLQLVNEMLDLSKLDKGKLKLFRQPTDIVPMIANIHDTFLAFAQEKEQTIFIAYSQEPIIANIDQDKLEKIIINLLSNAIKYSSKPGQIMIKISEKAASLEIQIADEGRGIAEKELPKIFDRYFQSEEINKEEGTGIGLSIVKEFVEMHEGEVTCTSEVGKGTTFNITFPDAVIVENSDPIKNDVVSNQSKFTLLVIEDHKDMRAYLQDKLTTYNTKGAPNGEKALAILENGLMPDLILTDYTMPSMDGYEFAKILKAEERWANIPIIFLTARALNEDKIKVLNLGIDDYIVKPFDLDELQVRVKNTLDISVNRKAFVENNLPDISLEKQHSFKVELDDFILNNLKDDQLSNTNLANHFSLSERNLFRRIKQATGQSPASYIREIRLQKARLILESQTELTVSEVALKCGITNLSYFSSTFKKRFGKSPRLIQNHKSTKFSMH